MKKSIYFAVLIGSFSITSCKTHKETTTAAPVNCPPTAVTYADIKPIFEASCTKCHNTNEKAGFNFFKLESIKKAVEKGELLGTIKHEKGFEKMPKMAPKLDQASIDKIECWIKGGMKE